MTAHTVQDVVLHVSDDPADVQHGLDAAARTVAALPDAHVRVIVNGPALAGVTGTEAVELPRNTRLEACRTGMQGRGITEAELRPGIQTVPAAVVALIEAQAAGSTYVRI